MKNFIIKEINKKRIKNKLNHLYINENVKTFLKYALFIGGDYITIWYINRDKEKGIIRYQYFRGICLNVRHKNYNTNFMLRSLLKNVVIEQHFNFYSLNNIYISFKKNSIKYYKRNSLLYLRKKKNKKSKFVFI